MIVLNGCTHVVETSRTRFLSFTAKIEMKNGEPVEIIPVCNAEKHLAQCLDSVCSQTLSEIICIDDGTSDSSGAILDDYARRDSRIRVLHQDRRGAGAARQVNAWHPDIIHVNHLCALLQLFKFPWSRPRAPVVFVVHGIHLRKYDFLPRSPRS